MKARLDPLQFKAAQFAIGGGGFGLKKMLIETDGTVVVTDGHRLVVVPPEKTRKPGRSFREVRTAGSADGPSGWAGELRNKGFTGATHGGNEGWEASLAGSTPRAPWLFDSARLI